MGNISQSGECCHDVIQLSSKKGTQFLRKIQIENVVTNDRVQRLKQNKWPAR